MRTLDLKQQFKLVYGPSPKRVEVVNLPRLQFVLMDGAIEKGLAPGNN